MQEDKVWWGEFDFAEGQSRFWAIGGKRIIIQRLTSEWNTWQEDTDHEETHTLEFGAYLDSSAFEYPPLTRDLQTLTDHKLIVLPALADRSIVTRPNVPLRLLANESVCIFVSTPLWFKVRPLKSESIMIDMPIWRPSDSWFGPSPREGELCYSKYTDARLNLFNLPKRSNRAITAINIINKSSNTLTVERLNVPVPLLGLYSDSNKQLWTESITITRQIDNDFTELKLDNSPPSACKHPTHIADPRIKSHKNTLIRSISSLFA